MNTAQDVITNHTSTMAEATRQGHPWWLWPFIITGCLALTVLYGVFAFIFHKVAETIIDWLVKGIVEGFEVPQLSITKAWRSTLHYVQSNTERLIGIYLEFEQECLSPVEDVLAMRLGNNARRFFPLAPFVQLSLYLSLSACQYDGFTDVLQLQVAFVHLIFVACMSLLAGASMGELANEIRRRSMSRDQGRKASDDTQNSVFWMVLVCSAGVCSTSACCEELRFWPLFLGLNLTMAILWLIVAFKHTQASLMLRKERKAFYAAAKDDELKDQRKKIAKLEAAAEQLRQKLRVEVDVINEERSSYLRAMHESVKAWNERNENIRVSRLKYAQLLCRVRRAETANEQSAIQQKQWQEQHQDELDAKEEHYKQALKTGLRNSEDILGEVYDKKLEDVDEACKAWKAETIADYHQVYELRYQRMIANFNSALNDEKAAAYKQVSAEMESEYTKLKSDFRQECANTLVERHAEIQDQAAIAFEERLAEAIEEEKAKIKKCMGAEVDARCDEAQRTFAEVMLNFERTSAAKVDQVEALYRQKLERKEREYQATLTQMERAHGNEMAQKNKQLDRKERLVSSHQGVFDASKHLIRDDNDGKDGAREQRYTAEERLEILTAAAEARMLNISDVAARNDKHIQDIARAHLTLSQPPKAATAPSTTRNHLLIDPSHQDEAEEDPGTLGDDERGEESESDSTYGSTLGSDSGAEENDNEDEEEDNESDVEVMVDRELSDDSVNEWSEVDSEIAEYDV